MKLTCNAYSPSSLAKELLFVVSASTIRREIKNGKLTAHQRGVGLIIRRADAEKWLNELPLATERTKYHDRATKRAR